MSRATFLRAPRIWRPASKSVRHRTKSCDCASVKAHELSGRGLCRVQLAGQLAQIRCDEGGLRHPVSFLLEIEDRRSIVDDHHLAATYVGFHDTMGLTDLLEAEHPAGLRLETP